MREKHNKVKVRQIHIGANFWVANLAFTQIVGNYISLDTFNLLIIVLFWKCFSYASVSEFNTGLKAFNSTVYVNQQLKLDNPNVSSKN